MSRFQNTLTTLEQVRSFLDTSETTDDAMLTTLIRSASSQVEQLCGRVFVPYKATLYADAPLFEQLMLPDDLLQLTSITVGDSLMGATDYVLLDRNVWPWYAVMPTELATFQRWTNTPFQDIAIVGTWGYNTYPDRMFEATAVALSAGVNAAVTTIPVSALTGIETLSYIYVDEELMQVTALVTTVGTPNTYSLTVKRGVNGYTAAAHLTAAVVYTYPIHPSVQYAATHYTLYLYQTRDDFGEGVQFGNRRMVMSKQLPDWIHADLDNMTRLRFYTPGESF